MVKFWCNRMAILIDYVIAKVISLVQAGRRALVLFLLFMLYVANVNQFFGKFPNETKLGFTSCS